MEVLDVTSAKKVLPDCITGQNGLCEISPFKSSSKERNKMGLFCTEMQQLARTLLQLKQKIKPLLGFKHRTTSRD